MRIFLVLCVSVALFGQTHAQRSSEFDVIWYRSKDGDTKFEQRKASFQFAEGYLLLRDKASTKERLIPVFDIAGVTLGRTFANEFMILQISHVYRPDSEYLPLRVEKEEIGSLSDLLSHIGIDPERRDKPLRLQDYRNEFLQHAAARGRTFGGLIYTGSLVATLSSPIRTTATLTDSSVIFIEEEATPTSAISPSPFKWVKVIPYHTIEEMTYEKLEGPTLFRGSSVPILGTTFSGGRIDQIMTHESTIAYAIPDGSSSTEFLLLPEGQEKEFRMALEMKSGKKFGQRYSFSESRSLKEIDLFDRMTANEFIKCGLHRLSNEELSNLKSWLADLK